MSDIKLLPLPEYFKQDLSHMTWEGLTQAAYDYARECQKYLARKSCTEQLEKESRHVQQSVAVDEEMVERFCRRWYEITGRSLERAHVLGSLDYAIAARQGGSADG